DGAASVIVCVNRTAPTQLDTLSLHDALPIFEQGAAIAQTLAQKFVADPKVVGILGPSTSGAVAASSATYFAAGLAHISPSATRTSLTKGSPLEATPAFLRVVPGDYIQGPSDANFMISNLKVKKVVILDFQEPYSVGLAA